MAKYRYLPRILRSWIAVDQLAPTALKSEDWDGLEEVWRRLDDTTTASTRPRIHESTCPRVHASTHPRIHVSTHPRVNL